MKIIHPKMTAAEMLEDKGIKQGAYEIWLMYYKKVFISDKIKSLMKWHAELLKIEPPLYLDHKCRSKISPSWLKSVREALFISADCAAKNIELKRSIFSCLERNEISGTITLNNLRKAAEALDCELIYGLVPKSGLTPAEQIWNRLYPYACEAKFVENVSRQQRMYGIATAAKNLMEDLKFRENQGWSTRNSVSDAGVFRQISRLESEKLQKIKTQS